MVGRSFKTPRGRAGSVLSRPPWPSSSSLLTYVGELIYGVHATTVVSFNGSIEFSRRTDLVRGNVGLVIEDGTNQVESV